MKRLITSILLLFSLSLCFGSGQHYEELLKQANDSYTQGNYEQAAELYEQVLAANYQSSALYYNMGNVYFKLKKYPSSILYYEKAQKLDPASNDIAFNLAIVNQAITDKIEPLPQFFVTTWWNSITSMFGVDTWAWVVLLFLFAAITVYALYILARNEWNRKLYFYCSFVLISITIIGFVSGQQQKNRIENPAEAIVFTPVVNVKSSPAENSTDLFILHEGTKVSLLENLEGWCKISLPDGNIGWIKLGDVSVI